MTGSVPHTYFTLKTCALFDLAEELRVSVEGKKYPPFGDPAGVEVLQRIATGLAAKGYNVSMVKQAYGSDAGFNHQLSDTSQIDVLLGIDRKEKGLVSCYLDTRWWPTLLRRLFQRDRAPSGACIAQWMQLCGAIKDLLIESFGATLVEWLTGQEANSRATAEQGSTP